MQDPYRIKFENGKISIALFNRGNPIPHTRFKGKLKEKRTQECLKKIRNKISDKNAIKFIDSFLYFGDKYKESMKKDFGGK